MRAPSDVVEALEALGFTVSHVSPEDDPAFTVARRDKDIVTLYTVWEFQTSYTGEKP